MTNYSIDQMDVVEKSGKYSRWDFVPTLIGLFFVLSIASVANDWNSPTATNVQAKFVDGSTVGVATLSGASVVVKTTALTSQSRVLLTAYDSLLNAGDLAVTTINAGSNFTITSNNVLDARNVTWLVVK